MLCSIEVEQDGIPYTQLTFGPNADDEDFFITFRRYERRVFVGVEDYRHVDVTTIKEPVPSYIIEKTNFKRFDPYKAFFRALRFLGEVGDEPNEDMNKWMEEVWNSEYETLVPTVQKWLETPLPVVGRTF